MNSDEVIEHAENMQRRDVDELARRIREVNAQLAAQLVANLGRCLECDEAIVEKERVEAGCVTCTDCALEIQRRLDLRNKQYAR